MVGIAQKPTGILDRLAAKKQLPIKIYGSALVLEAKKS